MEPFITIAELESYMDTDLDEGDPITTIAIEAACQAIRSYLQQVVNFVPSDLELHSGTDKDRIRLRERPVRDVISIFVDGDELDASTYDVFPNGIVKLTDHSVFRCGVDNIEVEYDHGWDLADDSDSGTDFLPVPADIRMVAFEAARRVIAGKGVSPNTGAVTSETIGAYSYTSDTTSAAQGAATGSSLSLDEKETLDWYVIRLKV